MGGVSVPHGDADARGGPSASFDYVVVEGGVYQPKAAIAYPSSVQVERNFICSIEKPALMTPGYEPTTKSLQWHAPTHTAVRVKTRWLRFTSLHKHAAPPRNTAVRLCCRHHPPVTSPPRPRPSPPKPRARAVSLPPPPTLPPLPPSTASRRCRRRSRRWPDASERVAAVAREGARVAAAASARPKPYCAPAVERWRRETCLIPSPVHAPLVIRKPC
jgi:hypothetical protein